MTNACEAVRDLAAGFVLGALEPAEERAVREHLATCPDPHPELAELGGIVPYLAEAVVQVEPPAALKGRILAAAQADFEARRSVLTREPATVTPFPGREKIDSRQASPAGRGWLLRVAAAMLVVALGGWNLLLQSQLGVARDYERAVATVLDVAAERGSMTAILAGAGRGAPRGFAAVASDGRIVMVVRDLPPTSGTEVYEAWVIEGQGAPVPIGGVTVGSTGVATFAATAPATAGTVLALTREPRPGATVPTLPIVASGTAVAPPG